MSETKRRRIDLVREPDFTAGLESLDDAELRRRRGMCGDLDVELSYYRRMLQGRMDLLAFEMRRRAGEEESTLIEALPMILSEGAYSPGAGLAKRSVPIEIPDLPSPGRRLVDRALDDGFLLKLPSLSDDDLRDSHNLLSEVEVDVSQQRRMVHAALDRLQAEIARRHREAAAGLGDPVADG